jgi:hypothetical protein
MDIKDSAFYSITETANLVNWSVRKLQRHAKKIDLRKIDNRYLFTGHQIKDILLSKSNIATKPRQTTISDKAETTTSVDLSVIDILNKEIENLRDERDFLKEKLTAEIPHQDKLRQAIQMITLEAMEQGVMHKVFTDDEYNDIIGTISEVDFQKEQVEYLRTRVEKQDSILQELVQQTTQRNFIEAKDKGFDKK